VIKSRRIRYEKNAARLWEMRNAYELLIGNLGGRERGDLGRRCEDNRLFN
jgi:hypothetical protein